MINNTERCYLVCGLIPFGIALTGLAWVGQTQANDVGAPTSLSPNDLFSLEDVVVTTEKRELL